MNDDLFKDKIVKEINKKGIFRIEKKDKMKKQEQEKRKILEDAMKGFSIEKKIRFLKALLVQINQDKKEKKK